MEKYHHPLEDSCPHLYNPVTGLITPDDVKVADCMVIGKKMQSNYIGSLPYGFYNPISSPIKTMCALKKKAKGNVRPVIYLENIFLWLLMIGQKLQMELGHLFAYELCAVPSSLIDEHGCMLQVKLSNVRASSLCKSNKSGLVTSRCALDSNSSRNCER